MTEATALENEATIRLACFLILLAVLAACEWIAPRRKENFQRQTRWLPNIGIAVVDTILLRLTFPLLGIEMALRTAEKGWGLLHHYPLPYFVELIIGVLILDLAIYLQHVLFHAIPLFWRVHRMHHSDLHFDVTTGIRFHPFEILLSMGIKIGIIALLGLPALSVLLFEILLNATSLFNHTNWNIPKPIDRIIRLLIVTPDMHRVHHSVIPVETNSNFGFNLSIWDRIFGTYRDQPALGHTEMEIGLKEFKDEKYLHFGQMLLIPFIGMRGEQNRKKPEG